MPDLPGSQAKEGRLDVGERGVPEKYFQNVRGGAKVLANAGKKQVMGSLPFSAKGIPKGETQRNFSL